MDEDEHVERSDCVEDSIAFSTPLNDEKVDRRKNKRKKHLMKEGADAEKRGVCYLSRVPPRMGPTKLRQILSQYGEILRIYLALEDTTAQMRRKRSGRFGGQEFSEGWVEFEKKAVAKRVATMLNGEQIGGKKRSSFYYDLWNIKYLGKFKWDDLTEEIAYKKAIREQKLALELAAAKRQCDFYLSKVDKSRALSSIQERILKELSCFYLMWPVVDSGESLIHPTEAALFFCFHEWVSDKQKTKGDADTMSATTLGPKKPDIVTEKRNVIRKFRPTRPLADTNSKRKQELSRDLLWWFLAINYPECH